MILSGTLDPIYLLEFQSILSCKPKLFFDVKAKLLTYSLESDSKSCIHHYQNTFSVVAMSQRPHCLRLFANSCCNCICLCNLVPLLEETGRCEIRSYITYNFELYKYCFIFVKFETNIFRGEHSHTKDVCKVKYLLKRILNFTYKISLSIVINPNKELKELSNFH